jgi:hypothetical protein
VDFVMKTQNQTYPEALLSVAKQYNIAIPEPEKRVENRDITPFRDKQLRDSGLQVNDQIWQYKDAKEVVHKIERYQAATVSEAAQSYWRIEQGDDMILHYVGLDGRPLIVTPNVKGAKPNPYYRIRWQFPENHRSQDGKAPKYKSRPKTGNQLWLPNVLLKAYQQGTQFDNLVVIEGEKKADKLCAHGMYACAISGIHNLSFDGMTSQFEQLIRRCGVKNVLFGMDADWADLSKDENVDSRPRTFANAVLKFRDYFVGYKGSGILLNTYWMYGKDAAFKGMDDLLTRGLTLDEDKAKLQPDIERAMNDREGKGVFLNCHNITFLHGHKIYDFWHLNAAQSFMERYKENLMKRKEFVFHKQRWRFNADDGKGGNFEMVEKVLEDEQFWEETTTEKKDGSVKTTLAFKYVRCVRFLKNRGFGLFKLPKNDFRMIETVGKVVRETTPHLIQQYMKDFLRDLGREDVLEMMMRGGTQYLGPHSLSQMEYFSPEFLQAEKESQILVFKNCYWQISATEIKQGSLLELPKSVWDNRQIDFEPKFKEVVKVERVNDAWETKVVTKGCDMWQFFQDTSNFWWEHAQQFGEDKEGNQIVVGKQPADQKKMTADELQKWTTHCVTKMIAAGYALHEYRNPAQMKAIICMDGLESEVGKSMGGSGKSIWAKMFRRLLPTLIIDGKKTDLNEDTHIYDQMDERTRIVVYDDVRVNFDFEALFSQITEAVTVNQKGNRRFTVDPPPVFIIPTNHAINGNDDSHARRQYLISFSNYYNKARTPYDQFGRSFFNDWDWEQWNLFYSFMACCIQTYLKFNDLKKYTIPTGDIEKRKLRQTMGENFLDWATMYFSSGGFLNKAVQKEKIAEDYLEVYPSERKFINARNIKDKVIQYCKYSKLHFNPAAGSDGRVKYDGKELLIVGNDDFDKQNFDRIFLEK